MDGQMEGQTNGLEGRKMDKQTGGQRDRKTDNQVTERWINKQVDRQSMTER
jgi:hypothetical protein